MLVVWEENSRNDSWIRIKIRWIELENSQTMQWDGVVESQRDCFQKKGSRANGQNKRYGEITEGERWS